MPLEVDRLPPQNIEAEQSVLGSLLIDKDAILKVASFLQPEDFYRENHRQIFRAVRTLYERWEPADFITVSDELDRQGLLDSIGGSSYLASLINRTPTSVHVEHYARIVERASMLRRLISASGQIAQVAYTSDEDTDVILDHAEQILFDVSQRRISRGLIAIREILDEYYDRLGYLREHRGEVSGVPSGFTDLDRMTGGFQPSDLVIVAARPGIGKTSLMLAMAANFATKFNGCTAIFSLEMSGEQLVQRLISSETGIDSQRLRLGLIRDNEWTRLTQTIGRLSEAPIYIDDTAALTPLELRSKARRLDAEHHLGLIMVDYLQLMTGGMRNENRVQEISYISRSLKGLARELKVPLIAASQLSRAVEGRQDRRPLLSDLRESGSIEQDADAVLFIYRDEMYNENSDKKGIADIILSKHRHGPTGEVHLRFIKENATFADLEMLREEPGELIL